MKNNPYMKSFYRNFLMGFAAISAMASSVQAADVGMPVLERMSAVQHSPAQGPDKSATVTSRSNAAPSQGAQGPIRTETFSDQASKVDSEMVHRDLELQRYPMSNSASIP